MTTLSYVDSLAKAMHDALAENDNAVIFGQGVDDFKGTFGTTLGLPEKFGAYRVQDTPLCEEGMTGICVGAALNGLKPIHIHIRADFLFLALNQVLNMAAKYKYMFGGHHDVPIFIRAVIGRSWGQGAQHSQSPQAMLSHFPGLKVIMPATSQSILESYRYAINDFSGPVVSLEHRLLYGVNFDVEEDKLRTGENALTSYIVREGADVTIVATSIMVLEAIRAAKYLASYGISCEVIDLHSPTDIDESLIIESVRKTGKLMVADTSWINFGVSAEIARLMCQQGFGLLQKPMAAIGMAPSPCPTAKALEDLYYPNQEVMIAKILELVERNDIAIPNEKSMADVYKKFKGPF
ncbi:alpha-ketoacid dehydrogenase subunit beta [Thalassotalea euphylliae]|uniref:Alpha-ketoacid dehydrogenase subunit beta n=1 Tax=Thalassotalea euphylliae TaxID=1655234 RepID=A0A3E0UD74_9GAMM|nr:transketolase C-terminal domain-containing protein [Thalassotalea euphylliae]REL34829.1 alpha-ketoacid dehydrogenase subunit beta [Thalassotalea euphylliae]